MGLLLILSGPHHRFADHPVGANADSENVNKKEAAFAQLLIRKLGSFIRLRRVLLLRSDIRLSPSGICYASLEANKISLEP